MTSSSEITELIGKRCKTRDLDDFPDLKEDERCWQCRMWDAIDSLVDREVKKARLEGKLQEHTQINRMRRDTTIRKLHYATFPPEWLDKRVNDLKAQLQSKGGTE